MFKISVKVDRKPASVILLTQRSAVSQGQHFHIHPLTFLNGDCFQRAQLSNARGPKCVFSLLSEGIF